MQLQNTFTTEVTYTRTGCDKPKLNMKWKATLELIQFDTSVQSIVITGYANSKIKALENLTEMLVIRMKEHQRKVA